MSDQLKDAKRTKVLWLTSSYPRNEDDSASIFLRYLAEALANRELDLLVLAPDHPEVRPFPPTIRVGLSPFPLFFSAPSTIVSVWLRNPAKPARSTLAVFAGAFFYIVDVHCRSMDAT